MKKAEKTKSQYLKSTVIHLGDEAFALHVRESRQARRMTLRFDPFARHVMLTVPRRASIKEALAFAEAKRQWLFKQILDTPPKIPFASGAIIPVFGMQATIVHEPGRGAVRLEREIIHVFGAEEFIGRRVKDWLKLEAQKKLSALAREKAELLRVKIRRISVRDTRSRWGSCNVDGRISFSWRLIFAPPSVLEYVVCHELAHLMEMNHSAKFWKLVEGLCPNWKQESDWLRVHGHTLYIYG